MMQIGLGTAAIGRPQYINVRSEENTSSSLELFRNRGREILDRAYELGVRYFDTAPGYGMAEELLICWLANKNDETLAVATKWGYTYVADFNPLAKIHEIKEHSLEKLNEQWLKSKELPFLKIYQIHSATLDSGVLENTDIHLRLNEIKQEHRIKIGLTATGVNQNEIIKRAINIHVNGKPLIDAIQATYNIYEQSVMDVMSEMKSHGVDLIVKEALANGRIFRPTSVAHGELVDLANKYEVGIDAIALRFCYETLQPAVVLSGGSLTSHLEDNLKALNIQLTENEISALKKHKMTPINYWDERKQLAWN